jgi:MYXO-CTERM domain-containing protein
MEASSGEKAAQKGPSGAGPQRVLFASSSPGVTYGVVCDSEPSSLTLLAAGVAGMAARRARRRERVKEWKAQNPQT